MKHPSPHSNERPVISVRQPWAHAILHPGKKVENKGTRTHFRGPILIQAFLKVERDEAARFLNPDALPKGKIVGSVEIVFCLQDAKGKWANPDSWHWILKNPLVLAKPNRV